MEPSPVLLNGSDTAFDFALRRTGWIAFGGFTVWGMSIPPKGKPFKVGKSFGFRPGANPRTIWVTDGHKAGQGTYLEYDGVERKVVDRFDLPPGFRLVDVLDFGIVVSREDNGCALWDREADRWDEIDPADVPAAKGTKRLRADEERGFEVVDDAGRRVAVEPLVEGGRVEPHLGNYSISPDGRYLAVDVDLSDPNWPIPSMIDIASKRVRYEPVPHRLAVIDTLNGAVHLPDGELDNFATAPVWSFDSKWAVFATPFAPHGLWVYSVDDHQLDWFSFGRRHAPGPLVDVSDLIP